MRFTFTLIILFLVAGCTTVTKPYVAPGVSEQSGASVYVNEYNRQIQRQGAENYCGHGECDNPPKLIKGFAPIYPRQMLARGVTGEAKICFRIKRNGSTDNFIVQSATAPAFAKAAIRAVELWKFSPATLHGKPIVLTGVCQKFPFKLR